MGAELRALWGEIRAFLVGSFLGAILQNLGLLPANSVAQERTPLYISNVVTNAQLAIQNPTYGLSALHADIAAIVPALEAYIATALDGLEVTATVPVQPSWYTSPPTPPDAATIAGAVWDHATTVSRLDNFRTNLPTQELLEGIWAILDYQQGFYGVPLAGNPWVGRCSDSPDLLADGGQQWTNYSEFGSPAAPDFSQWLSTDTVYSFLSRTQPAAGWTNVGPNGLTTNHRAWIMGSYHGVTRPFYCSRFTELDATIQAASSGAVIEIGAGVEVDIPPTAPVWPGGDLVTLGTPVPFTENVDVTAEMDGCIVTITTPPTRTGHYMLGSEDLWYGVGRISFENDDGEIEPWQYLAFNAGIFTPRSMAHASAVHLQVLGGAEGTVTPWAVTPG